jgi:hypothetical protein
MQRIKSGLPCLALSLLIVSGSPQALASDPSRGSGALPQPETGVDGRSAPEGDALESPVPPPVEPRAYQPLTGKQRWNLYVREAFWSPGAFFRAAGPALGNHLNNTPPEWEQGAAGYSRRLANRFGRFALQETYEAAGAAVLQHEVRYLRGSRSGFLPRAAHALTANFVTYDKKGRRAFHISRVGSAFAAEFTGNLWMPAGYRDTSTAMRGVAMELGVGSVFNLVREFSPELRRLLPWK